MRFNPIGTGLNIEPCLFGGVARRSSPNPRWLNRTFIQYLLRRVGNEALWFGRTVKARSNEFFGVWESEWWRSLQQKESSWKEFSSENTGSRLELCCTRHSQIDFSRSSERLESTVASALRSGGKRWNGPA
jgi:hypothetical protein